MEDAPRPVKVFVSYAHRDDRYRQKLHTATSPLRRRGLIDEWHDAGIVGGDEVDAEILRQLAGADIVLLLLSPSYIDSDYCWNKEMPAAFRLREHGDMRVVGIIVEPVHLDGLELTRHKLLPKDMKPIPYWHPQSAGWRDVCKGIEQVIHDMRHPSQVDDAIEVPKAIIANAPVSAQAGAACGPAAPPVATPGSVAGFWARRGTDVVPGRVVRIEGTFSQFAPMLTGAPRAKARLHRAFRESMESDEALRNRKAASLHACMSVSAGQMVWRSRDPHSDHFCFGLYDSIVRNSIPVLVSRDYWTRHLETLFRGDDSRAFEAVVTGRTIALDGSPTRDFIARHARDFIPDVLVDDLCRDVYALVVDGIGTSVERHADARYLDGDIWIAVESSGREIFLTSFLDIANPVERREELDLLFAKARRLPGATRIVAQYDDEHEFAPDLGGFGSRNQFLDAIWRAGFGGDA